MLPVNLLLSSSRGTVTTLALTCRPQSWRGGSHRAEESPGSCTLQSQPQRRSTGLLTPALWILAAHVAVAEHGGLRPTNRVSVRMVITDTLHFRYERPHGHGRVLASGRAICVEPTRVCDGTAQASLVLGCLSAALCAIECRPSGSVTNMQTPVPGQVVTIQNCKSAFIKQKDCDIFAPVAHSRPPSHSHNCTDTQHTRNSNRAHPQRRFAPQHRRRRTHRPDPDGLVRCSCGDLQLRWHARP
ncbi:hypothetical protein EDC01DRAFT_345168 [Geopyxis carbonaria]|nr:hypothetical protein EDC01DRAFT_345168 [Geopyxis carbonaria]